MIRPPLTSALLSTVSMRALHYGLSAAVISQRAETDAALGLLGRVKLWLGLIFSGFHAGQMQALPAAAQRPARPNRHKARLRQRELPLARKGDLLAHHIFRRYGRACFLNWIYNRSLTPRCRWCFTAWNWAWQPRSAFLSCGAIFTAALYCAAPLRPD